MAAGLKLPLLDLDKASEFEVCLIANPANTLDYGLMDRDFNFVVFTATVAASVNIASRMLMGMGL